MTRASDGTEVRVLAELDHKPWSAEDGEEWVAAFATDLEPGDASAIELSVAPDITVPLARAATDDGPGRTASRRRPAPDRTSQELQRLRARAADAAEAVERERERRRALEEALESERAQNRQVRIELGQLQAELKLAQASRVEAQESAAELERVQRELYGARQQLERATRERDRAAQAHAETRTALHEQTGALESAREALERERAERAGGVRYPEHPAPGPRPRAATPSFYDRASWGGRMLAVAVLVAMVVVIVLLIRGTIGH